jgi:hypothetical protein
MNISICRSGIATARANRVFAVRLGLAFALDFLLELSEHRFEVFWFFIVTLNPMTLNKEVRYGSNSLVGLVEQLGYLGCSLRSHSSSADQITLGQPVPACILLRFVPLELRASSA